MNNKSFRKYEKDKRRIDWMRQFEGITISITPLARGKICWDTATHLFNIGKEPQDAAQTMARIIADETKV